jgi:formylglycine-generating enzyme required for sulfatase activity
VAKIFISYRRDGSGGWAGRLDDWLSRHFGRDNVFMDINTIEPGLDFVEVIEQAVGQCDALIALIGKQWLTLSDDTGRRRLDNPEDFVRLEIAAALARNIRVIPVLVEGALMPRSTDLPDVLKLLARRNAHEISDRRFPYDVDRLIEVLDKVFGDAKPAVDEKGNGASARTALTSAQPREQRSATRLPFEPEMILIPAGEFLMGSDPQQDKAASDDEQPQHRLFLPDYFLAKTSVTHAQYSAFVRATGHEVPQGWTNGTLPPDMEDHPVVNVSWYDAKDYCQWLSQATGKDYRLPSEAKWEKGARGIDGRIYPWGNQWDATRCNSLESGLEKTTSVHAYPQGASPYGVLDMAGNVCEWTRSLGGSIPERPDYCYPYRPTDGRENLDAGREVARVLRGGGFGRGGMFVRCTYHNRDLPNFASRGVGFRVVVLPAS